MAAAAAEAAADGGMGAELHLKMSKKIAQLTKAHDAQIARHTAELTHTHMQRTAKRTSTIPPSTRTTTEHPQHETTDTYAHR